MSDERDPHLLALFEDANQTLEGEAFTSVVMARSRFSRRRTAVVWAAAACTLIVGAGVLFVPLQGFAMLIANGLTTSLIDVGEGWLNIVLSPINSVASLVAVGIKGVRVARNKIRTASFA